MILSFHALATSSSHHSQLCGWDFSLTHPPLPLYAGVSVSLRCSGSSDSPRRLNLVLIEFIPLQPSSSAKLWYTSLKENERIPYLSLKMVNITWFWCHPLARLQLRICTYSLAYNWAAQTLYCLDLSHWTCTGRSKLEPSVWGEYRVRVILAWLRRDCQMFVTAGRLVEIDQLTVVFRADDDEG